MSKSRVRTRRVAAGFENDIVFEVGEAMASGQGVTDAVASVLLARGIARYSDKITAMLRRGGMDIDDGQQVDETLIAAMVSRGFDFDFDDLSEAGIVDAIDSYAAGRLSDALGFTVSSIKDVDSLFADLQAGAVEAFQEGAGGLVSAALYGRAREAATWERAGYDLEARRRVQVAIAQRKYRRSNLWTWD